MGMLWWTLYEQEPFINGKLQTLTGHHRKRLGIVLKKTQTDLLGQNVSRNGSGKQYKGKLCISLGFPSGVSAWSYSRSHLEGGPIQF